MRPFSTPIVVFDLETTDCDEHAIIEIGAVALDRLLNPTGRTFQMLVSPDFPVSDFVIDLTGHSRESLAEAPLWPAVAAEFESWARATAGRSLNNLRLAAWGNYFDVNVLRNQYRRHGGQYPFSGTVLDVKTAAMLWLALSGRRTDSCSVSKVAKMMNIEPKGQYHKADVDADVTATILREVMSDLEGGVWVDGQYIKVGSR